jgi:hypothetical protein
MSIANRGRFKTSQGYNRKIQKAFGNSLPYPPGAEAPGQMDKAQTLLLNPPFHFSNLPDSQMRDYLVA